MNWKNSSFFCCFILVRVHFDSKKISLIVLGSVKSLFCHFYCVHFHSCFLVFALKHSTRTIIFTGLKKYFLLFANYSFNTLIAMLFIHLSESILFGCDQYIFLAKLTFEIVSFIESEYTRQMHHDFYRLIVYMWTVQEC